jgi:hypothetical protein
MLQREVLVNGRDACIADHHSLIVGQNLGTDKSLISFEVSCVPKRASATPGLRRREESGLYGG